MLQAREWLVARAAAWYAPAVLVSFLLVPAGVTMVCGYNTWYHGTRYLKMQRRYVMWVATADVPLQGVICGHCGIYKYCIYVTWYNFIYIF